MRGIRRPSSICAREWWDVLGCEARVLRSLHRWLRCAMSPFSRPLLLLGALLLVRSAVAAGLVGTRTVPPRPGGSRNLRLRGGSTPGVTGVEASAGSDPRDGSVSVVAQEAQASGTVKVVLRFRTNYQTRFGENMVIIGSLAEFGEVLLPSGTNCRNAAWQGKGARMQYIDNDDWFSPSVMACETETSLG